MKRVVKAATNPKRIPINTPPIPTIKKLAIPANMSITLIVRIWQKDLNKLYRTYEEKESTLSFWTILYFPSCHYVPLLKRWTLNFSIYLKFAFRYPIIYVRHISCHPYIPGKYKRQINTITPIFANGTDFLTHAALGARSINLSNSSLKSLIYRATNVHFRFSPD